MTTLEDFFQTRRKLKFVWRGMKGSVDCPCGKGSLRKIEIPSLKAVEEEEEEEEE